MLINTLNQLTGWELHHPPSSTGCIASPAHGERVWNICYQGLVPDTLHAGDAIHPVLLGRVWLVRLASHCLIWQSIPLELHHHFLIILRRSFLSRRDVPSLLVNTPCGCGFVGVALTLPLLIAGPERGIYLCTLMCHTPWPGSPTLYLPWSEEPLKH
jgi:hypothetical protein